MANERSYKVLLPTMQELHGFPIIVDLGEAAKGTAEASVAAVLDRLGPEASENFALTEAVAVPTGNWNECEVEEDPRPRFKVRRRANAAPETLPSNPDPDDAALPDAPDPISRPGVA